MHADVAQHILENCDRTRSKEARSALTKLFWKPLQRHGIELVPSNCLLAASNDILCAQEALKRGMGGQTNIWQCTQCLKMFRSEFHLDKHLVRRHGHLRYPNGTVCLADSCGTLIPCVPRSHPPLPPVTTFHVALRQPDSVAAAAAATSPTAGGGAPVAVATASPAFCVDEAARRRRIHACVNVVHDCLFRSQHGEARSSDLKLLHAHVQRLRVELCERAVRVECIPRHKVWQVLGNADDVLKTSATFPTMYFSVWAAAIVVVLLLISLFSTSSQSTERLRRRRRRYLSRAKHASSTRQQRQVFLLAPSGSKHE